MSASPLITAQPALSRSDWKRLNRLLAQALEVDADARAGWITSLPASDRDLLPVLEQLLARAESIEAMAATRAGPGLGSDSLRPEDTTGSAPVEEQPGSQIGPYRLLREIGRGGMGTVWLAERVDGVIQRQVALKLPRAEWTDRGLAERMARERSALASLNHPNIAQLYDAGWAADGRPFLALEYIEGEPIDAWCRTRVSTPSERVRLFVDVVRAVAFAHAKLVIHRDLKPSNVLITPDGRVKLLDFGIAKLLSADDATADETALTRFSGRALTLNYAAPEQILGQPISTAADTYSLGVMLFELLTGTKPYRLARDTRGALEEAIVGVDPPLPSSVATEPAAARALRGDLDAIVLKALRKKPEERYETAAAFADDLERWLDQRPVRAQRSSAWYRVRRFVARHRFRVAAGTVAGIAAVAAGSVLLWQRHIAGEDAARASSVRNFVLAIIAQADPMASGATREADLTLLTTAESRLADELASHPELALELRIAIARAFRNRGEFDRSEETLRRAIADASQVLPASDPRIARAWIEALAWMFWFPIDQEVWREVDRSIVTLRQTGSEGAEILIEGLQHRGQRLWNAGHRQRSIVDLREAHALAIKYFGEGHPKALQASVRLQDKLTNEPIAKRLELTENAYRAALANTSLSRSDLLFLEIQRKHGENLCEAGRGREGLELLRASVVAARHQHGDGLATELALDALSLGLLLTGDAGASFKAKQEAYAVAAARDPWGSTRRVRKANSVLWAAVATRNIEDIAPVMSEAAQAMPDGWKQALLVWLRNFEGDAVGAAELAPGAIEAADRTPSALSARLGWSYALRQIGRPEQAQRVLEPLAQWSEWEPTDFGDVLKERAAVQVALGDAALALATAETTIRKHSVSKLQTDPQLADLQLTRGQALLKLGRAEEALAAFRVSDDFWRSYMPTSHWAAEASYWVARALIETGDTTTGRPMLKAAQTRLAKSPMPLHRRLAAATAPSH